MSGRELFKNGINRLLSGTVLVTIAIIVNGAFSYLLQLALGRMLSVEDYGTFNALLSMFYIFSVPATVLGMSIVKIVSELRGNNESLKLTKLFWGLSLRASVVGVAIALLLFLLRNPLASYTGIEKPALFLYLGLYVLGNFVILSPQSYLRGVLLFKRFASYAVIVGFLRLMFPLTIVYLGYKVEGAYTGLFISLLLSYFVGLAFFRDQLEGVGKVDLSNEYKRIITFSLPVLLMHIGLMFLTNLDMVLVKKYFSGVDAGYYAGVVTLGKTILFGAGAVSMVMFPEISALKSAGKDYLKRLKFFILFQLGILIPAIILFTVFPEFITLTFFGKQFINSVKYVPLFALFMSLYVLANFLVRFFLAIEKTNIYLFLIIPVLIQFVGISLYHSNLHQVITTNIVSTLVLLVSMSIYLYKVNYDRINNRSSLQSKQNN